jgi:hypothetical protein
MAKDSATGAETCATGAGSQGRAGTTAARVSDPQLGAPTFKSAWGRCGVAALLL